MPALTDVEEAIKGSNEPKEAELDIHILQVNKANASGSRKSPIC